MSESREGVHRMPAAVRRTPPAAASAYALCRPWFAAFSLRAPKNCAIVTDAPEERPGEKPDYKSDDLRRGTAHAGECFLSHELPYDHAVYCVVELLEKCAQQNREKEEQKLLPDRPFGDRIFRHSW